jgi:hypothetical protein
LQNMHPPGISNAFSAAAAKTTPSAAGLSGP